MRKTLWPLFFGSSLILASFAVVACGDDDTNPAGPGSSSGSSGSTSGSTSGNTSSSGSTSGGTDGGDAGCQFPAFVINMINTQTRNDNTPSTDLGEACTDTQNQADFASLFQ